jgi:UDP-glucose 4-epimerase
MSALDAVFVEYEHRLSSVVHIASLKSVSESLREPMRYYQANVVGTLNLLRCCEEHAVFNILFSSSASIYGDTREVPVAEDSVRGPLISVYAETKAFAEGAMQRLCSASSRWRIIALRYFNPIGAHSSGLLGEVFCGSESNLLPILSRVVSGKQDKVIVFGNDYSTRDGTPVRDYVHVMDIARGHISALDRIDTMPQGFLAYNLGSGRGSTVLEIINACQIAAKCDIPIEIRPRREGDVAIALADIRLAEVELNWRPTLSLGNMMEDYWRFLTLNPDGYATAAHDSLNHNK